MEVLVLTLIILLLAYYCCVACAEPPQPRAASCAFPPSRRARIANVVHTASDRSAQPHKPTERAGNVAPHSGTCGYPIVREATVQRIPLPRLVDEFPTENVLDAAMLKQQGKRSQIANAHIYHTQALPRAIHAAARELTTRDPAIVPLDGRTACTRRLGTT